ncbi:hypothetical protein R3X28_03015 [Maribacter sp. TH_r10]|uniref:LSU ribosomal protein L21p n=1 Tax=Maribacter luteus TaxID=2594478 RepID=A0A6I2MIN6_9FLAO|nr:MULTISPECIES: hypothetical protein [Maribacter]MDV7137826.1 hypothetical protein [Maribacter sp. TH_r10]MRX63012.1 hypothetical protein [Maribacter luteus]
MDFSTMNIWCWLIPLLVGLLCAYFGYLLGKNKSTTTIDNSADLKLLQDKNAKLQADLDACKGKLSAGAAMAAAGGAVAAASMAPEPPKEKLIPFDAAAAKAAMGKTIKQDDLKVVEGIGPKISGMFIDSGIKTWKALSETSVADCRKVLAGGGDRYKVHDPASWPMQAKMCYEGKWKELAKWQDEHDHGKL